MQNHEKLFAAQKKGFCETLKTAEHNMSNVKEN